MRCILPFLTKGGHFSQVQTITNNRHNGNEGGNDGHATCANVFYNQHIYCYDRPAVHILWYHNCWQKQGEPIKL